MPHTDAPAAPTDVFTGEWDPFVLFECWLEEAGATEVNDPNAMALATVDADGMPDVRTVLLKEASPDGFVFYTNLGSAKGRELARHPKAALLFHWKSRRRQVRVRGTIAQVSDAEADAYFATRPRGSQIGAWASRQSETLESRAALEAAVAEVERRFHNQDVARPPHWSGFRLAPISIEFWQDGAFRLHDRILYQREGPEAPWTTRRLYP